MQLNVMEERMEKIIVYGLGKLFKKHIDFLKKKFVIVAYSDINVNMRDNLMQQDIFLTIEEFASIEFNKIVICGGGVEAKNQIFYRYMDCIRWEDIMLVEDIVKCSISKQDFVSNMEQYSKTNYHPNFNIDGRFIFPITNDISEQADKLDAHYFMQDICVARKVLKANPVRHYDVGSRIDGFVSHLLVFRSNVTVIDVRPLENKIDGLSFICADATNMSCIEDNSVESLSCLHALEHFGLGRYGDPIDAEACFKALHSFERVLKHRGTLYLSVPCGRKDMVCFNAHRIFSPHTIMNSVINLRLCSFEVINDFMVEEVDLDRDNLEKYGDYYCGIFTFEKE